MSTGPNDVPLHVQPMLSDIYYNKDLLDLSGIGEREPLDIQLQVG